MEGPKKNNKIKLPYDPAYIPFLGTHPKELKQGLREIFTHACSLQCYLQSHQEGECPSKCPLKMNKQNLIYPCNEILLSLQKEWRSDTGSMDEPAGRRAEGNKPDEKGQTPRGST